MQLNIFNIEYLKNLLQGFTSIDNIRSQIWIPFFFLNINKMKEIKILWEKSGKPLEWIKQIISNGIFFYKHDELIKFNVQPETFALRICWRYKQVKRNYELEDSLCFTLWGDDRVDRFTINITEIKKCDFFERKELKSLLYVIDDKINIIAVDQFYKLEHDLTSGTTNKKYKELSSLTPIVQNIITKVKFDVLKK